MKILCVEDDKNLAKLLQVTLLKQHYQVELAADGQVGWNLAEASPYDLIMLDLMLPKLDGISFCKQLRGEIFSTPNLNRHTPILLMTALDAVTNKVIGLDAGADDFVVKPFDLEELLARIRALLRRNQGVRSPILTWGELCLNPNSCEVTHRGKPVVLASKEYEMLELFLRNPEQIFSPSRLLDRLWTLDEPPSEGAVRAHIKGLRHKLKQAGANNIFETIYKLGYRLKGQKAIGKEDITLPAAPASTDIEGIWQKFRQSYCDRLAIIQQVITALQTDTLTPEQQHEAEREAHTLIGSLGCFGLDQASLLSRQIQQILQQKKPLGQPEAEQLQPLVRALQHHLEDKSQQNPPENSSTSPPDLLCASLLVIDDDLPLATQMATEAINWGFQAEIAVNLQQAQDLLTHHDFDVIVLDLSFSGSAASGLDFLAMIRSQHPEMPVVIFTAEKSFTKRVQAVRLGSQCFLQKPIAPAQVLAAVSQVQQQQQANKPTTRLLVIDDDPGILHLLRTFLEPCGYHLTLLDQPQQFWEILEQTAPDLLILDVEFGTVSPFCKRTDKDKIPPLSGLDLCQVIRSDPRWNRLPVIFLSTHTDIETVQRSFAAGADDFLHKPIVATELLTRVRTRLKQRKLWNQTEIDALTGLSLRRKALQDLTRLLQLAQRLQQPFTLAVLDLDHFKRVNDQYGHCMGDRVLSYVGKLLNQSFRQDDIVARWGGEEFILGMYGTTKQDGIRRLTQVLHQLSQYQFTAQDGRSFQITFSGGIAQSVDDGEEVQTLCQAADTALYQAKAQGRNCILPATTE